MQRQTSGLFQIGLGIFLIGVAIKVALTIGIFLSPFAHIAIVVGLILLVIGLVVPGRG